MRQGNPSTTSEECIRSWRFDRRHPVLLQGGGFDLARLVPKFSAVAPRLNKAALSSIVGGFLRLRQENLSPTSKECILSRRFDQQHSVLLQGLDQAQAVPKFLDSPPLQL